MQNEDEKIIRQLIDRSMKLSQLLSVIDHGVQISKPYIPYGNAIDLVNAIDEMKTEANQTFDLVFDHLDLLANTQHTPVATINPVNNPFGATTDPTLANNNSVPENNQDAIEQPTVDTGAEPEDDSDEDYDDQVPDDASEDDSNDVDPDEDSFDEDENDDSDDYDGVNEDVDDGVDSGDDSDTDDNDASNDGSFDLSAANSPFADANDNDDDDIDFDNAYDTKSGQDFINDENANNEDVQDDMDDNGSMVDMSDAHEQSMAADLTSEEYEARQEQNKAKDEQQVDDSLNQYGNFDSFTASNSANTSGTNQPVESEESDDDQIESNDNLDNADQGQDDANDDDYDSANEDTDNSLAFDQDSNSADKNTSANDIPDLPNVDDNPARDDDELNFDSAKSK